jgi:flagellar protein FliO/FliZ
VSASNPAKKPSIPWLVVGGAFVIGLGLFAPQVARSTPDTTAPTPALVGSTDGTSPTTIVFKMLLGIGVVAFASVGFSRVVAQQKPAALPGTLELLASLSLDVRSAVHLVRVGDRRLLIGIDAHGVKAVTELPLGGS